MSTKRGSKRLLEIAAPWLRVQACAGLMLVVLLGASLAFAAHRAKTSALQLGSEILTETAPVSGAESIEFNGAHFFFSAKVFDGKVADLLARAEAVCQREGADLGQELGPSLAELPGGALTNQVIDPSRLLTIRSESDQVGEVGCWVHRSKTARRGILERLQRFAATSDLSEFGSLQYVRAEQHGKRAVVRVLWSEGPLALNRLFPRDEDTPGLDLDGLPRPPGSKRILFGKIQSSQRSIVGYEAAQSPEQLNAFYGPRLAALGWKEIDLGERQSAAVPAILLQHVYERAGERALLALTPGDGSTGATFIDMPEH